MNTSYFAVKIRNRETGTVNLIKVPRIGVEIIEYFQDKEYIDDSKYDIDISDLDLIFDDEFDLNDCDY